MSDPGPERGLPLSRLLAWPLVALVRVYQRVVSPMTPPSCRFYPSCSSYAVTALERFGPLKGTWLAVRRLARCHPWNPGGVDHVPLRVPSARPGPIEGASVDRPPQPDHAVIAASAVDASDKDDRVRLLR